MADLEIEYEELVKRFGDRSPMSFKTHSRLPILKKLVWVLTNPSAFFNNVSHEGDVIEATSFIALCGLVGFIIALPLALQLGQTSVAFLFMTYLNWL